MHRKIKTDSLTLLADQRNHILLKYSRHSVQKTMHRQSSVRCVFHTIVTNWFRKLQAMQMSLVKEDEHQKEEEIAALPPLLDSG